MGEAMIRGRRTRINYAKDFEYTTNDTATLVTKYIGNKTDVIVPNKIEGKPVVLQNSVVDSSGSGAYNGVFAGNQNIKSVKFEEGVSFANNNMHYAFHECLNLVNAPVIPTNVTDLSYAFVCCANLASTPNIPSKVTNMQSAFSRCLSITDAPAIPASVTIMTWAFSGCQNLVNAPDMSNAKNVTNMYRTFQNCTNLKNAPVIPANVTYMVDTFYNCYNLVNAPVIPANVTRMGGTFSGCFNLINAPVIPANVTNMYGTFVNCTNLINAPIIPVNVSDLTYTFAGCKNLVNVPNISAKATFLEATFASCLNLVNAPNISSGITGMVNTYRDCMRLSNNVSIPDTVKYLRETFSSCYSLVNAPVIPENVISMYGTFYDCQGLTGNIIIKSNRINNTSMQNCFYGTNQPKNVYIPSQGYNAVANTWNAAFNTTYGINGKNGVTVIDDAALDWTYTTNDTATLLTKYTGTKADVVVPTTLAAKPTLLSTGVFKDTSVNSADLQGVNFANLDMANAFNSCTNLKSVKNMSPYINQANDAFHGCTNLTGVYAQNVTGGYEGSLGEIHNAVNMFRNCHNMTRVPDFDCLYADSTNIANYSHMFENCSKLAEYDCDFMGATFVSGGTADISYMFANCQNLTYSNSFGYTLLGNVNASHSFDNTGFKYLGQITDPNYLEATSKLGMGFANLNASYMFANCKNMVVADFGAKGTAGTGSANFTNAFYNCQNLTDVKNIPNGITSANYMFSNCRKLVNIGAFKNDVKAVAFMCRNCVSLKNAVEIPDGVTSMWGTYIDCTNLTNVPITAISLNAVDMDSMFQNCRNLVTAPIIPPNASVSSTFLNCTNLTGNIVIYVNKLTSYPSTFSGTTKAKNVYIYNTNTTSNMWNVWNNTTSGVNGKNGVTLINMGTWENACWTYSTSGTNTLVTKYKGTPNEVYVPKMINGRNVVLQNSVGIDSGVFINNKNITRAKFDSGVSIANNNMAYAFYGCSNLIHSPAIPANVISMGGTFATCISLVSAPVIPSSVTNMSGTFMVCRNLVNAPIIPVNVTNMYRVFGECELLVNAPEIPANVTDVAWAFERCQNLIKAPVIPANVTNMALTFYGCTNLTGNIKIATNRINNRSMTQCFNGTSKTKNVYIPFTGYNSVANTHNAAINSAYGINGKNGVTIYDINTYKG